MYRNGNVLKNMYKSIELKKVPCGLYHMLKVEALEVGEYKLTTRMCANEF